MGLLSDFFWGGSLLGGEIPEAKGLFNSDVQNSAQGLLAGVFPYGTPPRRGTRELLQAYRQHAWLRSAVHKIAMDVAGVPLRLLAPARKANQGKAFAIRDARGKVRKNLTDHALQAGELRVVEQHPFLDLIRKMNPAMRGLSARMVSQVYLDLKGETFWVKEKNAIGQALELWPVPPHWCIMTPAFKMPFFRFSWMGWNRVIDEDDVLWLRSPDPENPYWRGTGLGDALGDELDIDIFAQRHIKSWFYNRALPDAIISVEGLTSADRAKEYEERLREKHQGVGKGHQIHVASGKVTVEQLGQTFKENQMSETRQMQRDTIIQVLNIPPECMGIIENSNRATIDSSTFLYTLGVISPRMDFFCDQVQPLAEEWDESLIVDYVSPVPDDHEFKAKIYGQSPWAFSKNEVRALAGEQPLPGGDDEFPPMPSGGGGGLFGADKEDESSPVPKDDKGGDEEDEPDGAKAIRKDVTQDALDALRPDRLTNATLSTMTQQLQRWGAEVLQRLASAHAFDMKNPQVRRALEEFGGRRISGINRTTRDALKDTLQEGVAAGESIDELKKRVGDVFDGAEGYRAENIARTEVVGASNRGNLAAFEMSGVVTGKEWLAVQDAETRDTHRSLDGQVRKLGERFVADNGDSAECPGAFGDASEDCGCRCSTLPVIGDGKSVRRSDERVDAFMAHEKARGPWIEKMRRAFKAGFAKQREEVLAALR